MESLGTLELIFASLVIVVAYAVRGSAGFGAQAIAVPLLALILPLQIVVPAITMVTGLASFTQWRRDRPRIVWSEIVWLLPFTLVGVLAGLYIFQNADARTLTKAFGIFVILYALFSISNAKSVAPVPARFVRPIGVVLSAASGALGAIFGAAAGPLYAIYFNLLRLERDAFRATLTAILMFQALIRIAGYAQLGFYDGTVLLLVVAAVPLMVIGSRIGNSLVGRIEQHVFNRCVGVLLLASGVVLLLK